MPPLAGAVPDGVGEQAQALVAQPVRQRLGELVQPGLRLRQVLVAQRHPGADAAAGHLRRDVAARQQTGGAAEPLPSVAAAMLNGPVAARVFTTAPPTTAVTSPLAAGRNCSPPSCAAVCSCARTLALQVRRALALRLRAMILSDSDPMLVTAVLSDATSVTSPSCAACRAAA